MRVPARPWLVVSSTGNAGSDTRGHLHFEEHPRNDEAGHEGGPGRPRRIEEPCEKLVPGWKILSTGKDALDSEYVGETGAGTGERLGDAFHDERGLGGERWRADGHGRRIDGSLAGEQEQAGVTHSGREEWLGPTDGDAPENLLVHRDFTTNLG